MFSSNELRNAIVGSIIFLALMVACIEGIALYKGNVPVQVDSNTMNVTSGDLAQAMSKWRAQAPAAYEITVKQGPDQAILHVSDNDTKVQVLQYTHAGSPVSNSNMPLYPNVQQMSVQNLFTLVQNYITAMDQNAQSPATNGKFNYFYDFDTGFNSSLGYPTYIVNYQRETSPTQEIIWRSSPESAIEVEDLKAAK